MTASILRLPSQFDSAPEKILVMDAVASAIPSLLSKIASRLRAFPKASGTISLPLATGTRHRSLILGEEVAISVLRDQKATFNESAS
jgi:hypothetical protein